MTDTATPKRRPLVAGNWKMHGDQASNAALLERVISRWQGVHQAEVVVCPAYPYLHQVATLLGGSNILLGAQTLSEHPNGAHTGEVSAAMLVDLHCQYAIVGHSERRRQQGETDRQVAAKFVAAQRGGLVPILCVGESAQQREAGETLSHIGSQLQAVMDAAEAAELSRAVVAYEPIWAIGTGKTATPEQAQEVHSFIRSELGDVGQRMRILYGGSVRADNAAELFAKPDIDGALVGGASLDADEFLHICRAAE